MLPYAPSANPADKAGADLLHFLRVLCACDTQHIPRARVLTDAWGKWHVHLQQ